MVEQLDSRQLIESSMFYMAEFDEANASTPNYFTNKRELYGALFGEEIDGTYPHALGGTTIKLVLSEARRDPYDLPRITDEVRTLRTAIEHTQKNGTLTTEELLKIRQAENDFFASVSLALEGVEDDVLADEEVAEDTDEVEPVIEPEVIEEVAILPDDIAIRVSRLARRTRGPFRTALMALSIVRLESEEKALERIAKTTADIDRSVARRINGGSVRPETKLGKKVANPRTMPIEGVDKLQTLASNSAGDTLHLEF